MVHQLEEWGHPYHPLGGQTVFPLKCTQKSRIKLPQPQHTGSVVQACIHSTSVLHLPGTATWRRRTFYLFCVLNLFSFLRTRDQRLVHVHSNAQRNKQRLTKDETKARQARKKRGERRAKSPKHWLFAVRVKTHASTSPCPNCNFQIFPNPKLYARLINVGTVTN